MKTLSHFNARGQAHMVDVATKGESERVARAGGVIRMRPATLRQVATVRAAKGDVLGIARIAAIQAAKRTANLIPLCHPLALTHVSVDFRVDRAAGAIECTASVSTLGRTGVEMEALTAVSVGLLTVYDMLKAVDRGMRIERIALLEKMGGRSGHWVAPKPARRRRSR